MPLNRNSRFIMQSGNVVIELRCGESVANEFYFLPDDMLVGDLEISGSFDDDLPIGITNALTCKIKINTESFTSEMAELGAWIRDNESPIKRPNVWIVYRNSIAEYIGVQEPSLGVKHTPKTKEFEINLTSVHKWAMERVSFTLDTPSNVADTVLDIKIMDYVRIRDYDPDDKSVCYYKIAGWGRTKLVNFFPWLYGTWLNKVSIASDYVLRNDIPYDYYYNNEMPIFFKPVLADDGTKPTEILDQYPKAISEIWESESGIFALSDLKGGILQTYYQQFKTFWNFYKIYLRGQAKRCIVKMRGDININDANYIPSIGLEFQEVYVCSNDTSPIIVESDDVEASSNDETINEPYNTYRSVTNRNMVFRASDIRQIEVITDGGSTAKNRYETTCCIGTNGNTVDKHMKEEAEAIGLKRWGLTNYTASQGTLIPCSQLLYFQDIEPVEWWQKYLKIADYCQIPCHYSGGEFLETSELSYNNTLMNIDGKDNFNKAINQRQSNGYAKLCADIINEVIAKRQVTITITLPLALANPNNVGKEYRLEIEDLYKTNYFYDDITIGNKAILTNIKANYSKDYAECTFFIRNDIYAS